MEGYLKEGVGEGMEGKGRKRNGEGTESEGKRGREWLSHNKVG